MAENISLSDLNDRGDKETVSFPRIVEHAVGKSMADVVPALSAVLRLQNMHLGLYEMVSRAELSARDLTAKVSALAELFGGEDSVSRLRMASYDIEQFFTAFTRHLNVTISDKLRGEIIFQLAPESEKGVVFDARRVSMILYHLIGNALQHGRTENKNIKLICKAVPGRFELAVRDYGGGVPADIQPKLFTKFRDEFSLQNQSSNMLPPRICGIGLPLCRKLIQDMGGKLEFKNYSTGAKFTMILPQETTRMQEPSIFYPEKSLLLSCMAPFLLQVGFERKEEDNR